MHLIAFYVDINVNVERSALPSAAVSPPVLPGHTTSHHITDYDASLCLTH